MSVDNDINKVLDETIECMNIDDMDNALKILDNFMLNYSPSFECNDKVEYHCFDNPLDEILFNQYIDSDRTVEIIPDDEPVSDLYYIYGFLLFEHKKYDNAEEVLNKALEFNPVSASIYLELSEIYKLNDLDKFLDTLKLAYNFAYNPEDIARYYRNLGYYYMEIDDYKLATALYLHSIKYELNNLAYMEIEHIESLGYNVDIKKGEEVDILKANNIPTGANPFIIDTVKGISEEFEESSLYNQAAYFYKMLYEITLDDNLLDKIYELEENG